MSLFDPDDCSISLDELSALMERLGIECSDNQKFALAGALEDEVYGVQQRIFAEEQGSS